MIDKALEILKNSIHAYLVRLPGLNITSEETIHLTPIVKANGELAIPSNSLGLTIVNIEEERVLKSQIASAITNSIVSHINPEIKLNLYILLAANFADYKTGLGFLSGVLRFFQSKNVFTHENTPGMNESIRKLIVELYTLNFEQQNHLWGALGAKYIPSVLYRVRLIIIQEGVKSAKERKNG